MSDDVDWRSIIDWNYIVNKPSTYPPDSHNHNLNDLAEKSHVSLTDKGTNTHAQIDAHIAAGASGTYGTFSNMATEAMGNNYYYWIDAYSNQAGSATETARDIPCPFNITVLAFGVSLTVAPGVGTSRTFTVRDDVSSTAITATVSGTNMAASWTGSVNITASSMITLLHTLSGSPAACISTWQVLYKLQ